MYWILAPTSLFKTLVQIQTSGLPLKVPLTISPLQTHFPPPLPTLLLLLILPQSPRCLVFQGPLALIWWPCVLAHDCLSEYLNLILFFWSQETQWSKVKLLSRVWLFETPWTVAYQAAPMGFSRQGYWSGLPFPSPEDFPHQESSPGLLHCRQTLYRLSRQGRFWSQETQ